MITVAIHQPQYLPYLGFFHKMAQADVFVALDNVQFQKNGLQNRNKIKTSQGWQWLTVPVRHDFGQEIRQVKIDRRAPWQRKHWNALLASYGRAPFFEALRPGLQAALEADHEGLCGLNMALTEWAGAALGITTPVVLASQLDVCGSQSGLLIAICRALGAGCYLSGPGGRRYMDLAAFEAAGIEVRWQAYVSPEYDQLFQAAGFVPDLSVVDVLFNCGPAARTFVL